MAKTTKKTTKATTKKTAAPVVETKVEAAVEAPVVEEVKEEAKKAPAKKATTKKTAAKKATLTTTVTLQFAGKSHTEETLTAIAKDVWKYDLNKEEADLATVELYVKPEEGLCYYVFNGDVTGSFVI